jgi:hypothetical protein
VAQLYLKVNEETKAFPFIEALAGANAPKAKELAQEFLTVWTKNHDPNSERSRTNTYMFMYGFEQRASGIPLTRSKQERNLAELAVWLEKLRALPIGELDEQLVLNAFTTSHSTAEVFRLETIEKVFGPMDRLKPRTLAELAQRMRTNLATVWRRPDVQEQQKTKRKQKDIEREVLAGYEVAKAAVARALERHADHWALLVARAALQHDENNFRQEVQKSSEFAGRRQEALRALAAAADRYVAVAPGQPVEEETTQAFETWFYASLGACDLGAIDEQTQLAPGQTGPIRDALARLPGECGERHRAQFANTLFTRMSAVKPVAKHRYLKAGFEIVGDHPQAYEARKVFDYYKDLVTEIRLVAEVDGSAQVGTAPFGVRVSLRHTREIERESGGFGKYLQNQMNVRFAWNYGRPLENYRDKFQEAASQALAEHFEVRSITFNSEEVRSKADAEYGWRLTPYAYLLLSAKGPQVDRIPPLKLDLDFLDTSGYAVLPIESPAVPIDASKAPEGPRPHGGLEITQILDERRAAQGLLGLEIKATGRGLVPGLEELLDLAPPDFEVAKRNDQGLSVSRFADDHEGVISERLWTFQLRARPGLERPPSRFRFAVARVPDTKLVYQRYADADLVIAEPEVSLVESYGRRGFPWLWTALGAAALALGAGLFVGVRRARRRPHGPVGLQVPASITPFTVLGLLREIERHGALGEAGRGELRSAIAAIETHYFAETNGESPDLRQIAEHWVRRSA